MTAGSQFEEKGKMADGSMNFRFLVQIRQSDLLEANMYAASITIIHVIKSLRSKTEIRLSASVSFWVEAASYNSEAMKALKTENPNTSQL